MEVIIDTSAVFAVILGEPSKEKLVEVATGRILLGPMSLPWEIGNGFASMLKQRRMTVADAQNGLKLFEAIPIRLLGVDLAASIALAGRLNMYAYDAYFVECAIRYAVPLLTLDAGLKRAAESVGVEIMEV